MESSDFRLVGSAQGSRTDIVRATKGCWQFWSGGNSMQVYRLTHLFAWRQEASESAPIAEHQQANLGHGSPLTPRAFRPK
jgi:hypothetical protein